MTKNSADDIQARVDNMYTDESVGRVYTDVMFLLLENKRLREALEWYADEANNHREIVAEDGQVWVSEVAKDGGLRATQALAGKEPVGYIEARKALGGSDGS